MIIYYGEIADVGTWWVPATNATVAQEEFVATAPSLPFAIPPKRQARWSWSFPPPTCLLSLGVRQVAIKPAGEHLSLSLVCNIDCTPVGYEQRPQVGILLGWDLSHDNRPEGLKRIQAKNAAVLVVEDIDHLFLGPKYFTGHEEQVFRNTLEAQDCLEPGALQLLQTFLSQHIQNSVGRATCTTVKLIKHYAPNSIVKANKPFTLKIIDIDLHSGRDAKVTLPSQSQVAFTHNLAARELGGHQASNTGCCCQSPAHKSHFRANTNCNRM